jgi:hypothetical protein
MRTTLMAGIGLTLAAPRSRDEPDRAGLPRPLRTCRRRRWTGCRPARPGRTRYGGWSPRSWSATRPRPPVPTWATCGPGSAGAPKKECTRSPRGGTTSTTGPGTWQHSRSRRPGGRPRPPPSPAGCPACPGSTTAASGRSNCWSTPRSPTSAARLAYTTSYALVRSLARRAGCRTSRTPWATPTPAPPAATTAPGTTSTGTPPLPDGHPTAPHDRSATGVARQGRRRRPHTPVIARLVSADGAEEWWPARAVRWTEDAVLIGYESSPGEQKSLRHLRYRRRRASDPPSVTRDP